MRLTLLFCSHHACLKLIGGLAVSTITAVSSMLWNVQGSSSNLVCSSCACFSVLFLLRLVWLVQVHVPIHFLAADHQLSSVLPSQCGAHQTLSLTCLLHTLLHYICKRGWSNVITGFCFGFRYSLSHPLSEEL